MLGKVVRLYDETDPLRMIECWVQGVKKERHQRHTKIQL